VPVDARSIAFGAAIAGAAASFAYTILAVSQLRAFRRRVAAASGERARLTPPITVLKPLHGDEPNLYEHLASACRQEYPRYQIVFGAADPQDPALDAARRVQRDFPGCDVTIVAGEARPARNPKIGNLLGMLPYAKYDVLAIADSDMSAGPQWLRSVAQTFGGARTGAVTCLYGATPDAGIVSKLAAMFVNEQFSPSVLAATALEPLSYCFGATMAVTREVLRGIGGLEALADHLADDYRLGALVREAGYRVELAPYVLHTGVARCDAAALLSREVRWARTIRGARPAGYAGSILENVLLWGALAAALCDSAPTSVAVLSAAVCLRLLLHREAPKVFSIRPGGDAWLIPLRDALSAGVWIAGLSGRRVGWRGMNLSVEAGGRMLSAPNPCKDSPLR
jgi:ceramide glucosyltransferase